MTGTGISNGKRYDGKFKLLHRWGPIPRIPLAGSVVSPARAVAPPPVAVLIGLADTQTSLRGDLRLSDSAVLTWTQVFCKHG